MWQTTRKKKQCLRISKKEKWWSRKPRNIWLDDVKHDLKKMGVKRLQKNG